MVLRKFSAIKNRIISIKLTFKIPFCAMMQTNNLCLGGENVYF